MTQPPADSPIGQPDYPRQELLPQQVQPRRRRTWLVAAAAVVVVAVVVGVVVWRVTGGGASGDRAVYCQRLRAAVHGGSGADIGGPRLTGGMLDEIERVAAVAPAAVRPAWDDLLTLAKQVTAGQKESDAVTLSALDDVQTIVSDANANCGLHLGNGL